jgi:lipoprotein NlpD
MKQYRCLALVFSALLLAACASKSPAPVVERGGARSAPSAAASAGDMYTIKKGDTLYSIALDHGLDHRELAAWNNIENPNRIRIGQQLRVKAPGSTAAASDAVVTQPIGAGSSAVEQRSLDASPAPAAAGSGSSQFKTEPKAGKVPYSEAALAQAQQSSTAAAAPAAKPESKPEAAPAPAPVPAPVSVSASEPSAGADDVPWIWPASGKVIGQFSEAGSKGLDIGGKAGDAVIAAGDGKVVYAGTGLRGYGKLIIVKHNATFLSAYAHNQNLLVKEGQTVSKGQKIAEMGNTDADQVKLHFEVRRQGKPVDPMKYLPPR